MKVSVCMISYNQSLYIDKAIEGVMAQKTNFDYELIIGDDCSTDGTQLIIQKYKKLYPNKIKILPREKNMGMMNNFISVLEECKGKYVAICEGDDYWIEPLKIQKQVDFLDENPNFSVCFSKVYEQIGNEIKLSTNYSWNEEKTFDINELSKNNFIYTVSVLYRNGLVDKFPDWFQKSPIGDYVLHMLNAKKGLLKYFPDPMVVYRKESGTWSSKSVAYQAEKLIDVINYLLIEDFSEIVKDILKTQKRSIVFSYCKNLFEQNNYSYLVKMHEEIYYESEFIKNWMLDVYPNKIKNVTNSRTFKIVSNVFLIFTNLKSWFNKGE